jgi:hypothetical protein
MKAFLVNVNELSPRSRSRWQVRQQIADDTVYAEQLQHRWDTECKLLLAAANKRQPGRPKKTSDDRALKLTPPSDTAHDSNVPSGHRIHWFGTAHIHDILHAYEVTGSGYKAIQWLECHRPKLKTESIWRFSQLNRIA